MDEKNITGKWSPENIEYLRISYLKGHSLKYMSAHLNRSISAINKVLARHNLRTPVNTESLPSLPGRVPAAPKQKPVKKAEKPAGEVRKFRALLPDCRYWKSFTCVIRWLRSQNITITKAGHEDFYVVRGYPKNKQQVLFFANLMRDEQQLPPFFVEGVTFP